MDTQTPDVVDVCTVSGRILVNYVRTWSDKDDDKSTWLCRTIE